MNRTKLILLNGFLGAGKTTLMLAAADALREEGLSVACVTNDQGSQLVDSKMVFKKELPLRQIEGGCFCCRFDQLAESVNTLISECSPDIIMAEAVGSCTDLVATVIQPLVRFHGEQIDVRPLTVVVDPYRLAELVDDFSAFSDDVLYIFQKQLEEAHCILLNKSDLISEEEQTDLYESLTEKFKLKPIIPISARDRTGVSDWLEAITHLNSQRTDPLEIDYDRYADGEAELGWLNASLQLEGRLFNVESVLITFMENALDRFRNEDAEVAHMKLWAQDERYSIKMSSVGTSRSCSVDQAPQSQWESNLLTVWINARVNMDSAVLGEIIKDGLEDMLRHNRVSLIREKWDCFAPGRPVPTFRFA